MTNCYTRDRRVRDLQREMGTIVSVGLVWIFQMCETRKLPMLEWFIRPKPSSRWFREGISLLLTNCWAETHFLGRLCSTLLPAVFYRWFFNSKCVPLFSVCTGFARALHSVPFREYSWCNLLRLILYQSVNRSSAIDPIFNWLKTPFSN